MECGRQDEGDGGKLWDAMRPHRTRGLRQIVGCNASDRIMWQAARKRYAPPMRTKVNRQNRFGDFCLSSRELLHIKVDSITANFRK